MRLVINATELGRRRGGNESYLAGLIAGLAALPAPPQISLLTCEWGAPLELPPVFEPINLGPYRRLPFFLWQQTLCLRRLRPDWYISTFFLPPILPCRGAVLVHDLSFRAHPDYFPASIALYMRLLTGLAVRQAERVVALSEFTRRELMRFHPAAAAKTVVIYPGVDASFSPAGEGDAAILGGYGLAPGYILAVGNIHPRKNLARVLDAYLRLRQRVKDPPALVWVGLPRWESGDLLERARAAEVALPGFVAQADLPALYRQAMLLVYPSLYEGFGLPPLEAMACGTPVIASDTTSLPEVMGKAGLLVDPTDVEAIAGAMAELVGNPLLRRRLREAGLARAQGFTWRRTAERLVKTLAVQ